MSETFLGMDFGGTKLLIGASDASGKVLATKKYDSGYMDQRRALDFITQSLEDYFSHAAANKPAAMGMGLVGRVDGKNGVWLEIDRERGEVIPICEILTKRFGIPCRADNDVRSAAKAELRFGHGRNSRHFIYINLGTGIAAGMVTDGQVVYGNSFNAGEVGHTHAGIDAGTLCVCGRENCVETIASGRGLNECARRYAAR
ncbi:MAG: ROK family protein, partial [Clostridiales bacterium]|nr:ROK family protein [Clostridiales bacterium]